MKNKKVLIFMPKFPVRTETFIKRELSRLVERDNFDYTIFALEKGNPELEPHLQEVTVYERLSPFDVLKGLSFFVTDLVNVFAALKTVGLRNFYTFIKGLGYAHKISRYDPDIIYAQFLSDFSSIALVASIILDVEYSISAHARDILEYPHLTKEKVKRAKFIAICNENAYEAVKELAGEVDSQNVKLIYHGLDPKDLRVSEDIQKAEPPLIFCVARYVKKKGLTYLIEAAEKIKKEGIDFKMKIAGGGPLQESLQSRIDELGLRKEVELIGEISFENVKRLYHRSSVYTQPSINAKSGDADGIPNTLIESSMLRIPIVTTDAGSITDFLDEEAANIVPQRDAAALADGIIDFLRHPNAAKELTEEAYKRAIEKFDIDKSAERVERLLA